MKDDLTVWVHDVLGDHARAEALPLNDRKRGKGQRVRAVRDREGRRWILKQVAVTAEYDAEVHAYRSWTGSLGGRAPELRASEPALRSLLLSEVRGSHPAATDHAANRQAGALLRRLHDSLPARPRPAGRSAKAAQRLERLLDQSRAALDADLAAYAREQGALIAALPLDEVTCHGDYRPHNWLVDHSGTLRMIDFGKSRREVAAWDLAKLFLRPWWSRPRLAAVFLEGYGRPLHVDEAAYIESRMALDALSHVAFGVGCESERHVRFGRERLAALVAGHRVVPPRLVAARRGLPVLQSGCGTRQP